MDSTGDFVVIWSSPTTNGGYEIFAQRFSPAGVAQGGEIQIDSLPVSTAVPPSVAMDAAGDFVVTWATRGQNGSPSQIDAQRYNAAGAPLGTDFEVDNASIQNRITPTVEVDPNGNLTSTHQTYAEDVSLFGVFATNGIGYFPGSEFQFNTPTTNSAYPGMPMEDEGNWFWT